MYPISLFALFAFALYQGAFGVPQGPLTEAPGVLVTPLADLNGDGGATAQSGCDFCFIVADVAALVWYTDAFINTAATAYFAVSTGNGSRITRTSIVQNETPFTFDANRIGSAGMDNLNLIPVTYAPTAVVGGATLRSPTAYNVFTAYTLTSAHTVNGQCVTTTLPRVDLSSAYSETLTNANGKVSVDVAGQEGFIKALGFSTCSGGGERAVGGALVPVSHVTQSVTTTYNSVPLAAMTTLSLAPTTKPTSSARPAGVVTLTEVMSSTTVTATFTGTAFPDESATAPVIVIGSSTLTPTAAPFSLPILPGSFNGSFVTGGISGNTTIIGSTQFVGTATPVGTGVGGSNYTGAPFISEAARWQRGGWSGFLGLSVASILIAISLL